MDIAIEGTLTKLDDTQPGDTFQYDDKIYLRPEEDVDASGIALDDGSKVDLEKDVEVTVVSVKATITP